MSGLSSPLTAGLVEPVESFLLGPSSAAKSKPMVDYLLWLGSSTPAETSINNTVLGRQEHALRAALCSVGIDVPVISRAVGGRTIGTQLSAMAADLAFMGSAVANGKKVGVLLNVGSNNIGLTDIDAMGASERNTMLANLNSILDQIEAAGMIPLLATVHSRSGAAAIYEEWADRMWRPLIQERCPQWFKAGLAVFDYCRLYTTSDSIANWYQGDGLHPNVATGYYQAYTAAQLKANAKCKPLATRERYLFAWPTAAEYIGGVNQLVGAASGTFVAGSVRDIRAGLNPSASLTWSGATGSSGGARGNSGVWDIELTHHRLQSASLYKSGAAITLTASFGAGYAGRTGKLRATGNSSTANRFTQVSVGGQNAVINASTGISVVELPFTLNSSGQLTITAAPYAPSTFANISGLEFDFDPLQ